MQKKEHNSDLKERESPFLRSGVLLRRFKKSVVIPGIEKRLERLGGRKEFPKKGKSCHSGKNGSSRGGENPQQPTKGELQLLIQKEEGRGGGFYILYTVKSRPSLEGERGGKMMQIRKKLRCHTHQRRGGLIFLKRKILVS